MKRINVLLLMILAVAIGLFACYNIWVHNRLDTVGPVVTIDEGILEVSVKDPEEALLAGIHATDDRDGDVTGAVLVESIYGIDEDNITTVTYAAFDGSGNVQGFLCQPLGTEEIAGLMLPTTQLMDIATQIVEKGYVTGRPYLGLQVQKMSNFCRQYWGLEYGLEVVDAQANGLLAGDILLKADGQTLDSCHQLHRLLLATQLGDTVTLEIFRAGQRFTITLPVNQIP